MFTLLLLVACAPELVGDPAAGEALYASNCASCHGADGEGGSGPAMADVSGESEAEIADVVLYGAGDMPAIDVDDQAAADIAAYVVETWGQ